MKLFWRIFLAFWLATILMIAAVLGASEFLPLTLPGDSKAGFHPGAVEASLTDAINIYEKQGRGAMVSALHNLPELHHRRVYLMTADGRSLAGDAALSPFDMQLMKAALENNRVEIHRSFASRLLYVCPLRSGTGQRYAAIVAVFGSGSRLLRTHFWFNVAVAMFPSALVCLALSFYITNPITRLRTTAQRLADGDLGARSSPHRITRRDELGDLARDFDTMAARIEQLMTAQRRFVADISHELGAPLTRMHLAQALLQRESGEKGSVAVKRIERETHKLSNLVQQLLLLAGMEAGRCPAETMVPVSLQSLCKNIVEDVAFEAEHADCRIAGSRENVTLLAYPQLLRRAIDNVLRNAVRYTSAGSEVFLNCRADEDQQTITIEVLDSGPGVPDSMLSDIFLPFFRTSPGRENDSGGTGLGLAIAAEAIRMHDGSIEARNRKEGGLRVIMTLPLRTPTSEQELLYSEEPSKVSSSDSDQDDRG